MLSMSTEPLRIAIFIVLLGVTGCGVKVDTGRNSSNELTSPEGRPDSPSDGDSDTSPAISSCFTTSSDSLDAPLQHICDTVIGANPKLSKINEYLCQKKYLLNALSNKSCGWAGDPSVMMKHVKTYERVPEASGQNYEDIHASILLLPKPARFVIGFVSLAFENYAEFKQQNFKWIPGTRESINLNSGTMATGVAFKFRIDRDASYELGYKGHIQIYQLSDKQWIHVMYATDDFVRVTQFAQVALYSEQDDKSVIVVKLEHRGIDSSGGLYNRVWQGAVDLVKDFMNMCWNNSKMDNPLFNTGAAQP
jgi:hypothetical protein